MASADIVKNFAFIRKLYKRNQGNHPERPTKLRDIDWWWQELDNALDDAERNYWIDIKNSGMSLRNAAEVYVTILAIEHEVIIGKKDVFDDTFFIIGLGDRFNQLKKVIDVPSGLKELKEYCQDLGNPRGHPNHRIPEGRKFHELTQKNLREALKKFHIQLLDRYGDRFDKCPESFSDSLIPILNYDIVAPVFQRDEPPGGIRRFHVRHKNHNHPDKLERGTEPHGLIYIYPNGPASAENKKHGLRLFEVREKINIGSTLQ